MHYDPDHSLHELAPAWFRRNVQSGWMSCPVTQNGRMRMSHIHGPRDLTELCLLAFAVSRGGRFVTFDSAVPLSAIKGAEKRHLVAL
jgi:hypothetical protein